jgi:tRNA G18 (ribose-2'-O)-methylase SpoU
MLAGARRVAVVEDVNDHENLGVIFRSAGSLGLDAVLLSPRCCDPLYRRSVRVSMGGVFAVPFARATSWPGDLERIRAAGFTVVALTPAADSVSLREFRPPAGQRIALLVGTEGAGLSRAAIDASDVPVRIPMAAGVDSLNVATATGIALWELSR